MFVEIGTEKIVKDEDILGMFDLDNASQTSAAKEFFRIAQKNGKVTMLGSELPKTMIVMKNGDIYLSQYAQKILTARAGSLFRGVKNMLKNP